MLNAKKEYPAEKEKLHPRNKHRERYDFRLLTESSPELAAYVSRNAYDDESIDFFDPKAVLALNKALLKQYYGIRHWEIPQGYLCPPIPGRADYIHHIADLLYSKTNGKMPAGNLVRCLDIGTGANGVYPIIGSMEYGWTFIGSDIDPVALASVEKTIALNPELEDKIELRLQSNAQQVFYGIIRKNEFIDLTVCNPPFHSSAAEAEAGTVRKLSNLKGKKTGKAVRNFGGQHNELWSPGGEARFIRDMIRESHQFALSCFWFSTIVSRQSNLKAIYEELQKADAVEVKTIAMGQGNKASRIVAWTFLSPDQQKKWMKTQWGIEV